MNSFDKLRAASAARQSLLCIGLDPEPGQVPGGLEGAVELCRRLIDATADAACSYKPNAAFWEQYGPRGWDGLARVRQSVPADIPVILDCKRADVPNTMAAYATAVFARFPGLPFLLPGIGRQGGDVEASVRAAYTGDAASCLIAVAGAIMYAEDHHNAARMWRDRIQQAAEHAHQR